MLGATLLPQSLLTMFSVVCSALGIPSGADIDKVELSHSFIHVLILYMYLECLFYTRDGII